MRKFLYFDVLFNFIMCFITHSIYDFFSNSLTLIFFPANESNWEHGKMVFTGIIIVAFIELLYFKFRDIKINNLLFFKICTAIMSIFIILLFSFINNFIYHILLLLISLLISEFIFKKILQKKEIKYTNLISLIIIIFVYIAYGYLTYHPIINDLFLDKKANKYGINTYILWD